ncbi:MAG TPA: histidine phosphatase family protein [Candidatus Saccharimonadales bacterium]|jgi:broad specificity phosphatase PhoE
MTTFYICRHGVTVNNQAKRFSGWIDTPLTEEGVQNALSAAAKLDGVQFDRIVSSDLGRAFITAYIITRQLGISTEIERNQGLREMNYGDFANRPHAEYPLLTVAENAVFVPPNGESLVQVQQRVLGCITELADASPNKIILLTAHDGIINSVRAGFSGEDMGTADLVHNAHDFVAKFAYDGDKILSFEEVG